MNRDAKASVVEAASDDVQHEQPARAAWKRFALPLAGFLCFAVALTFYILRLDRTVGMFVDDAWYVLLAKAIATGHGYTIVNSPTPGILPLYPPGFPALLAIVFKIAPDFPQNVWLLKSVSIAAMMGVGLVTFWYFRRGRQVPGHLALAIATATTLSPPLVFLATSSVMSEAVFTLSFMLTIALVERGVQLEERSRIVRFLIPAGVVGSYAFLTRSIGVALLGSVVLYLLKLRQLRSAVVFSGTVILCVAPWLMYSRTHAPTPEQRDEQRGMITLNYGTAFWQRKAGSRRTGEITLSELPARVWNNLSTMMTRDAGEMTVAKVFYIFQESDAGAGVVSFIIGLFCIVGYISAVRQKVTLAEIAVPAMLMIVLLWPWETLRFVLPMTAFAVFYLLLGLRSVYYLHLKLRQEAKNPAWAALTILAGVVIFFNIYGNVSYLVTKHKSPAGESQLGDSFAENEGVLHFINERLPDDAIIASGNPALIYLYTGRKTIASDEIAKNWNTWNRVGVRYLAYVSALPVGEPELAETRYTVVYKPRGRLNLRIVDLGPPDSRPVWGASLPPRMNMIN
jgi:hypothetical protein